MNKRMSIVDIAKALNVSKTTVSFVLNGRAVEKRISTALAERIISFVEEVGYKANSTAKSLRTGKTNIISLIMDDIANPFFAHIAKFIEKRAYEHGYCVIYGTVKSLVTTENLITAIQDNYVEACIIAPPANVKGEVITALLNDGFPVVMFNHYLNGIDTNYVGIDNQNSAYRATYHLIEEGYDNIAFITYSNSETNLQDRVSGYSLALKKKRLKPYLKKVSPEKDEKEIIESLATFLYKHDEINAVIFSSEQICKIGLKVIKKLRLTIPDDIAVITFDDCELFEFSSPSISAIVPPIDSIAENIFNLLLKALKHRENAMTQKITLPANLKIRDSAIAPFKMKQLQLKGA